LHDRINNNIGFASFISTTDIIVIILVLLIFKLKMCNWIEVFRNGCTTRRKIEFFNLSFTFLR
jgi:hypothetical protein